MPRVASASVVYLRAEIPANHPSAPILGEERMIASEVPGTTRDSVSIDMERDGRLYRLVDTAGLRRKSKVDDESKQPADEVGSAP